MEQKLRWYVVEKDYINYLRNYDKRIENIEYGNRFKPYVGIIIKLSDYSYYIPITSAKPKHERINENLDFVKIVHKGKILCVLNINNMIPINDNSVQRLNYREIEKYRVFSSKDDEKKYIRLLDIELKLINKRIEKIVSNAEKLYKEKTKNPNSNISKRCCDFKILEEKCMEYTSVEIPYRQDVIEAMEEAKRISREPETKRYRSFKEVIEDNDNTV